MKKLIITEKRDAALQMIASGGLDDKSFPSSASALEAESKKNGFIESDKFVFTWAMGHMFTIELPERVEKGYKLFSVFKDVSMYAMEKLKDAPFVPDNDQSRYDKKYQKEQYDFCAFKINQYNKILKQLKRTDFDEIILAADADAEGERIGTDLIVENLKSISTLKKVKVTRFWNTGSFKSKEAVEKAMKERKEYTEPKHINLFYSARARAKNDYIIGMKGTKLISETYHKFLTVGRVQSPVMNLLYLREEEIKNFKPKPFWKLNGLYKDLNFEHFFYSEDINDEGKPIKTKETNYFDKAEIDEVIKQCKDKKLTGTVVDMKKSKKSTPKPLLYSTNTFQVDFMGKYKANIDEADAVIEYLRDEGFTTYPRTNGHYFAKVDFTDVENSYDNAKKVFSKHPYVLKHMPSIKIDIKNPIFDTAKAEKQNHTPIIITTKTPTEKDFDRWDKAMYKGKKLKNVKEGYFLIANRFMIQVLPDDEIERQNLTIEINGHLFETTGEKIIDQGWRELTGELKKDTSFSTSLKKGDSVTLDKLNVSESLTKKPPMYNVASLQKTMVNVNSALDDEILAIEDTKLRIKKREEYKELKKIFKEIEGIGTNATRKEIIMKLKDRKFITITGSNNEIALTEDGRFLVEHTPMYLKDIKTTALWEIELEKIRLGEITYNDFIMSLDKFYIDKILPEVFKKFDGEKSVLFKPSEKQIAYAESIALKKGLTLPAICRTDKNEIKKWIDEHKDEVGVASDGSPKIYTLSDKQKTIIEKEGNATVKKLIEKETLDFKEFTICKKWLDSYFKKSASKPTSKKGGSKATSKKGGKIESKLPSAESKPTYSGGTLSDKQKAVIAKNGTDALKKVIEKETLSPTDLVTCREWLNDYFSKMKK